jgi:putative acyl-CoA dehydrogenase
MGINAAAAPDQCADVPGYATHEVLNQASALAEYDAYANDKPLVQAMKVFGADWADEVLHRAGSQVGSEKVQYLARQANRHLPELRTHDRFGNRIDVVEFHPAYHELMGLIYGTQAHSFAWTYRGKRGLTWRAPH